MEDPFHHPNIGAQIRSATRHSLDVSHCSPSCLKLSDGPPPAHDYPYDTARCDFHCVGKWEPVLHRFAIYLLHKLNEDWLLSSPLWSGPVSRCRTLTTLT